MSTHIPAPAPPISRRSALCRLGAGLTALALPAGVRAAPDPVLTARIPATGEKLPVIGMGTWRTFNVGRDPKLRADRAEVLRAFFDHGGGMIDSSPMYGSSQAVVGWGLDRIGHPAGLFAADKVWTGDGSATRRQAGESRQAWGIERFDLLQVHNLVAWENHLPALRDMKAAGRIRYLGITTSHGRRHDDLERIMATEPVDFVQLTLNIANREAENRLLPLAKDRSIAVIVNRPFGGGPLVKRLQRTAALPDWAHEVGAEHWPGFLLKFIVSHPAVTCAIPATTRVDHMHENMSAGRGRLPTAADRERMAKWVRDQ